MPRDLLAALALVAVLEGLLLFAAPEAWRRMVEHLVTEPSARRWLPGPVFAPAEQQPQPAPCAPRFGSCRERSFVSCMWRTAAEVVASCGGVKKALRA